MKKLHIEIYNEEKKVFAGEVDRVIAPGVLGEFAVLPDHATMFSCLKTGNIVLKFKKKEEQFSVSGGFLEVRSNKVVVFTTAL